MLKKVKIIILTALILILILPSKMFANTVEYLGEAEGLITTPSDFFLEFGELLPGDEKTDIAYIQNKTNDKIEVFFKTEPLTQDEYYDEIDYSLLEKIKLKITLKPTQNSEEQLLYEGNLGAELMNEYISLGEYNKGYDGEFIFKIEVPTDLKNSYTLSTTKVKWVFAVEKDKEDEANLQNENNPNTNEDTKDNPIKQIAELVKTGDNIYYLIALLIILILVIIIIIIIKRRMKKNEKEN